MDRWRSLVVVVFVALFAVTVGVAQEAPQPTPEHKALEMWVGDWTGSGEVKPGPFGPGGPMSWTESCSWFQDSPFNVVCKSKGTGPMGPMKGLGIVGYNAGKKVYTHYGVDSTGWSGYAEGTRDGDTWTFTSEETMGDQTFLSRFSMSVTSPQEMAFTWQVSEDGNSWTTLMEGTSKKK